MNELVRKLNEAYRATAERRRLALIDLGDVPADCFVDGIHLTQAGNRWVAEKLAAAISARNV